MNAENVLKAMLVENGVEARRVDGFVDDFKDRVAALPGQLDGKRCGLLWERKNGAIVREFFAFVPRDRLSTAALQAYRRELTRTIADGDEQRLAMDRALARWVEWQRVHYTELKLPDAIKGECL